MSFAGGSHLVYEFYYDCCSCGICNLVGPGGGEFVRKPLPWAGAFVDSSGSSNNIIPLSNVSHCMHIYMLIYIAIDITNI